MQPKCTHLPIDQFTFLICHPCYLCTLIRVLTAITWCKAEKINQTLTAELKSSPNLHIYPTIHLLFLFVIFITLAPSLGFPTTILWCKVNKVNK